ncbi:MAG: hypothetical protein J1F20_05355 [Muribaculaceae bacterium]|nr:hypothetical protein [Muribaculaceae bacterium]
MLIFKIAPNLDYPDTCLQERGVEVQLVAPSIFSFLTSVRISSQAKKKIPDAIFVYTVKEALSATSARRLLNGFDEPQKKHYTEVSQHGQHSGRKIISPLPIVFFVTSETKCPLSIPAEVCEGIDAIVFDNETTRQKWHQVKNIEKIKRQELIVRPAIERTLPDKTSTRAKYEIADNKTVIEFIGNLNTSVNLRKALDNLVKTREAERFAIRICGTAKPGNVMPLVKRMRGTGVDVKWLGEDYILADELALADAFIQSEASPDENEIFLLSRGIPSIPPNSFSEVVMTTRQESPSKENNEDEKSQLTDLYSPAGYADRVLNLIEQLR